MTAAPEASEKALKRSTLLAAVISSFLAPYLSSSVNVALPAIQEDLSATAVQLSWMATSFVLVNAMLALPLGKAADIWGRKRMLAGGIALITVSSAVCWVVEDPRILIALRAVQGLGSGTVAVTSMAIVSSVFPPEERGSAFGLVIAAARVTCLRISLDVAGKTRSGEKKGRKRPEGWRLLYRAVRGTSDSPETGSNPWPRERGPSRLRRPGRRPADIGNRRLF